MKKLVSILLAILCAFSVFSCAAAAAGALDDLFTEEDDAGIYCLVYSSDTLSNVSMMYVPHPTSDFDGPGYAKVTNDTPLSVDYNFVCWKDGTGKYYYPGDEIYVNGMTHLYAVWEPKTDDDSHLFRVIKTALQTLERVLQKVFGIFKTVEDFRVAYEATSVSAEG